MPHARLRSRSDPTGSGQACPASLNSKELGARLHASPACSVLRGLQLPQSTPLPPEATAHRLPGAPPPLSPQVPPLPCPLAPVVRPNRRVFWRNPVQSEVFSGILFPARRASFDENQLPSRPRALRRPVLATMRRIPVENLTRQAQCASPPAFPLALPRCQGSTPLPERSAFPTDWDRPALLVVLAMALRRDRSANS